MRLSRFEQSRLKTAAKELPLPSLLFILADVCASRANKMEQFEPNEKIRIAAHRANAATLSKAAKMAIEVSSA